MTIFAAGVAVGTDVKVGKGVAVCADAMFVAWMVNVGANTPGLAVAVMTSTFSRPGSEQANSASARNRAGNSIFRCRLYLMRAIIAASEAINKGNLLAMGRIINLEFM
jgi:hypothetical protein